MKREPVSIILQAGTNNATNLTARKILGKLVQLKPTILNSRKSCHVIISQPTLNSDNGKALLTNHQFRNLLEELNTDIVEIRNIDSRHLARDYISRTVTSTVDTLQGTASQEL